jgi:hypothetical protein
MNSRSNLLLVLLFLAVIAYFIPWLVNPGISLSLGAYDLAEWVSLILPERPLTTMLLLRLPPACLAVITALTLGHRRFSIEWWFAAFWVLMTAITLLPPFEFLSQRDDPNYRQQFLLATGTLVTGCLSLTGLFDRVRIPVTLITSVVGIGVSLAGLSQAHAFMQNLRLPVQPGLGGMVFVIIVGLIGVIQLIPQKHGGRS